MPPTHTTAPLSSTAASSAAPSTWELARVAIDRASERGDKTILVLPFTAPTGDPLTWLSSHHGVPSVYWRSRDGWEYAGVGVAHAVGGQGAHAMESSANEAAQFLRLNVVTERAPLRRQPRFLGGFAFDPHRISDPLWSEGGFGDAVLVLPEAMYIRNDTQSYMLFAFEVTARSTPESLLERLTVFNEHYWRGLEETLPDQPLRFTSTIRDHDRRDWVDVAADLIARIEQGAAEKIVLARRLVLATDHEPRRAAGGDDYGTPDAWPLLRALRGFDSSCYHFGFQFHESSAFVGASPERLFRLEGRQLESEALAGTVTRGVDEAEDCELAHHLRESAKEKLEHQLVVVELVESLARLSASGQVTASTESTVIKLRTLQHLRSVLGIDVRADVQLGEVLDTLHPTPAVAGVPLERALRAIRETEPCSRGWYGGPVGWIAADAAEFAVGIRSALLSRQRAFVYAGAGLVRGSQAEREWQETEDKLQVFLRATGVPPASPAM